MTSNNWYNYAEGTKPFLLDLVKCTGNEDNIVDCELKPWGYHNCRDFEIAGVYCVRNGE